MTAWLIAGLVALPVSFGLMILFGCLHYRKISDNRPYSFTSYFPYELYGEPDDIYLALCRVFTGLFLLLDGLSSIILLRLESQPNAACVTFAILVGVFGLMQMLLLFFLFMLPARYSKAHIYIVVFFFCVSVLYGASAGIYLMNYAAAHPLTMGFGIAIASLALLILVLLVNPKFSYWAKLHVAEDKNGEKVVFRPRIFILAASEWLVILIDFLISFLLLLTILLINLQ